MEKSNISVQQLIFTQKLSNDTIMPMGHISFMHYRIGNLRSKRICLSCLRPCVLCMLSVMLFNDSVTTAKVYENDRMIREDHISPQVLLIYFKL
jgi:hypothetical protein